MADRNELIVGGYYFGSFDDARLAEKEIKNAKYLEERTQSMNVKQMKAVYDKMIDEKMFSTPVGWEYLKFLKERLVENGISEEDIRPIPLYCNFISQKRDILAPKDDHIAKRSIRPSKKRERGIKDALRTSVLLNVILFVLVIAMFIITLKSDNPNILNYKQAITNEYSAWEQELTDRENAVREREKALENTDS